MLDKLKYAHFDEIAAGLGGATGLHTYAAAPQAAGYTIKTPAHKAAE